MIEVIDLRTRPEFIPEYVEVRNGYLDLLRSRPVNIRDTEAWLAARHGEVRCLVEGERFLGAIILYPERDGEVAFFVRDPGRGVGRRLLGEIEPVAKARGFAAVWAWVLTTNERARRAFVTSGYRQEGIVRREYPDGARDGYLLRKEIDTDGK